MKKSILMEKDIFIPALIGGVMIALFLIVSSTLSSVVIFIPAVVIAYLFYIITAYKNTPNPKKILPFYLFALGVQLLHFTEEYITGFNVEILKLIGASAYPTDYWLVFNMVAYSIFIMGGIILSKRIKSLIIIPLFFIVAGIILNGIGHILLAIYTGGYFPGLFTALIYIAIVPIILNEFKKERNLKGVNIAHD